MKTLFGQCVCELVFGVNIFDLDLGSKLIRSNNQSSATLWVQETCLFAQLLPLVIILFTAALSSTNVQLRLTLGRMCVSGYVIHFRQLINLLLSFVSWCLGFLGSVLHKFPWCYQGWVLHCCWLNVTPQLQCPRDREQVIHPCVIQHLEKWFQSFHQH